MRRRGLFFVSLALISLVPVPAASSNHWHDCLGKRVTIRGTYQADVLTGTEGQDVIVGQGGNDTIFGQGGRDIICGNKGHDVLVGGTGFDRAHGGPDVDSCEAERKKACE